jgi:cysteine desulfurase
MTSRPIYLDYQAHAPMDPRVLAILIDACTFEGNPHAGHTHGARAKESVETARAQVAALIRVRPSEIVFTSGATESNNLAVAGLVAHLHEMGRSRVLVGAGEHPSLLAAAERSDCTVERVPLLPDGHHDLEALRILLDEGGVGLVSLSAANHEVGTVADLTGIAELCSQAGALLHSDVSQAVGSIAVSAEMLDLASFSAHKLYGPAGVGSLYVRRSLRSKLTPLIVGGGQEGGLRAGTLPAALCVAFGAACELTCRELPCESERLASMRDRMLEALLEIPGASLNGARYPRLPGNINIGFDGVDAEALLVSVKDRISISSGSACTSSRLEPSHVLLAMGLGEETAEQAVRIGLGRWTTDEEVEAATSEIEQAVKSLRSTRWRIGA